jgi:hypothetical protein
MRIVETSSTETKFDCLTVRSPSDVVVVYHHGLTKVNTLVRLVLTLSCDQQ